MSAARGTVAGLVALSLSLTLLPAAFAAPVQPWSLSSAPAGAFRVDLSAVPDSGAMLLVAVGPSQAQFYSIAEEATGAALALAYFDIDAEYDSAPLSCARLATLDGGLSAFTYSRSGVVHTAIVNPWTGEQVAEVALGAGASQPCIIAADGGFWLSFLERGTLGTFQVTDGISAAGIVHAHLAQGPITAASAALIPADPAPLLAVLGGSQVSLFALSGGAWDAQGTLAVAAYAGAMWTREGSLLGLFSTNAGLVKTRAPLDALSTGTSQSLAGPPRAFEVFAVDSGDGMLLASIRTGSGMVTLREDTVGSFSTSSSSGLIAAAASADGYGLARAAVLASLPAGPAVQTFTAGDGDAVAITLSGPTAIVRAAPNTYTATVRAVRSAITLVGLDVSLPPGWVVEAPSTTVALAKGASAALPFTVTAPAGTAPGSYALSVRPSAVEAPFTPTASMHVQVAGGAAVAAVGGTSSVDLLPGASTTVSITLVNRGATPALTDLAASAPSGLIVQPPRQSVSIAPGASATVTFTVSAAKGALPLEGASLWLAISPGDESGMTWVQLPATIRGIFSPVLEVAPKDISGAPSAQVALPFSIVNAGNLGGLVQLQVDVDGPAGLDVQGAAPYVFVPAFGSVSLPTRLTLPDRALAGAVYQVALTATHASDGTAAGYRQSLSGIVLHARSFSASFAAGAPVAPGADAQLTVLLRNDGNAPVAASLSFASVPAGFLARLGDGVSAALVVAPHASLEVPVVSHVPADAAPGGQTLQVLVSLSEGGSVSTELRVEEQATHGLTLTVTAPPSPLTSDDQMAASFDFAVGNTGNTATTVSLDFASKLLSLTTAPDAGTPTPADSPFTLAPHSTAALRARVTAAFATGDTEASTRVSADASSGDSASAVVSITRLGHDLRVVDLTVRPLSGSPKAGTLHTVSATLANAGPGTATGVIAVLTANDAVVGRVKLAPFPAGPSRVLQFDVVPTAAETLFTLHLVAPEAGLDRDHANDAFAVRYLAEVAAAPSSPLPPGAAPAAGATISILALIGLALSEIGKITLISGLFLPLYVKLKPEEVLDQYLRGQIHGYIIANPGEHYNAIKDQLGVTNGALAYHLRVLERAELIRPVRDGMYKRFYPVGVKIPKRKRLSPFQAAIVRVVRANADVSQKGLAEILGVSNQVVNYNVKQLEDANIIKVDRSSRASKLTLGPDAPPAEDVPAVPAPAAPVLPASP